MKEKLQYNKYKDLKEQYEKIVNRFSNIRMITFIIMLLSFILKYYYYKILFNIIFTISLVTFIIIIIIHNKYFKIYNYYDLYIKVLEKYIARENGNWKKFIDKGNDFLDEKNHFLSDLDIVGNNSLFQYLSICKTLGGREKLIEKLSNIKSDAKELESNQKFIEELTNNIEFCINFQVTLDYYDNKNINLSKELDKFKECNSTKLDIVIGISASILSITLFILGLFNIVSMYYFYGVFFFNIAINYMYNYIYREEFNCLDKFIYYYSKLIKIFNYISNYKGNSNKMKRIIKDMNNIKTINNKLIELDWINSLRSNLLSNLLVNGLCCLNLFTKYKYSYFMNNSLDSIKICIFDIEEMEAMISLASIGIVKKNICLPIYSDKLILSFKDIKHPLIDEEACVTNSYSGKNGVNIITGSNMGGKTTYLRTIGINLILMQAGTYVCSSYMNASYFKIFTSMRVTDNIEKGISYFYGELLRIKDMIEYANKDNMLVLIDEIFKGTNYNDRMYGAKEIVNKLNNKKTIAFITTHDFELCDSTNVTNYHVSEDYEGDKIIFDYKIKDGKSTSTNAKYLMKKLGIID